MTVRAISNGSPRMVEVTMTRRATPEAKRCARCDGSLEGRGSRAKFCSTRCRQRAFKESRQASASAAPAQRQMSAFGSDDGAMHRATLAELEELGRVDHYLGRIALALARQIDSGRDPGSVAAALMRELRNTMAAARVGANAKGDPIDELAERRRARVFGG